jgi:uncharacterized protein YcsI (UPF0317 family)
MTVTDLPRALLREDLANASGRDVRAAARSGQWRRATHGLARGYVQANMAIVPKRYAFDFMLFCQRNPKPCPIIDITDPGDPEARFAAPGSDVRVDLPGYRVFRDGELVAEVFEITDHWRSDSVAFLLGCSNSMDDVLLDARIPQRHLESEDGRISVYASNIMCAAAGIFRGPVVVTMRPIPQNRLVDAISITARYPMAHGAPVHVGDPRAIGIDDLSRVDWGKYNELRHDDVPVFWACGVTPQAVAAKARIPEMITHAAGHMFVSDLKLTQLAHGTR